MTTPGNWIIVRDTIAAKIVIRKYIWIHLYHDHTEHTSNTVNYNLSSKIFTQVSSSIEGYVRRGPDKIDSSW